MNDRTRVERPSTRRARPPKLARWLGFTGLFLGVAACGSGGESAAETPPIASAPAAESNAVGSIELGLALGDSNIRAVSYSIIGNQFQTTGVIDVSRSTQIASEIGGIPFGTNYVVTLTAASADGPSTTCSGSASFDVTSQAPVNVPVHVTCKEQKAVAATPAPLPGRASFALCLALLGVGLARQKRARAKPSTS